MLQCLYPAIIVISYETANTIWKVDNTTENKLCVNVNTLNQKATNEKNWKKKLKMSQWTTQKHPLIKSPWQLIPERQNGRVGRGCIIKSACYSFSLLERLIHIFEFSQIWCVEWKVSGDCRNYLTYKYKTFDDVSKMEYVISWKM